ncbi:MAG: hypothetical protein QXS20_02535 [Candidatus Thorarchaeota archaeon]
MSKKKWGKTTQRTERIVRDAIPEPKTLDEINQYLSKARSFTEFDIANKFNVRVSVARRLLRDMERKGTIVPYIRECGFVAYTTPAELARKDTERPVILADVLEDVARATPATPFMTEEMELALAAASLESMKPSKIARQRRALGERKERVREKKAMPPETLEVPPAPARREESDTLADLTEDELVAATSEVSPADEATDTQQKVKKRTSARSSKTAKKAEPTSDEVKEPEPKTDSGTPSKPTRRKKSQESVSSDE